MFCVINGYLYGRGAVYWREYMVDGKWIRASLGTDNDAEAERLQVGKMRPMLAPEEADVRAFIANRLSTALRKEESSIHGFLS